MSSQSAGRGQRPSLSDLGMTPVARGLLAAQIIIVALSAAAYPRLGLTMDWASVWPPLSFAMIPFAMWVYYYRCPGGPSDWAIAERCLLVGLFLLAFVIFPQIQYVAFAMNRPLVGGQLAEIDAMFGLHVGSLAEWTAAHPAVHRLLQWSYFTLFKQMFMPLFATRVVLREYLLHFYIVSIATALIVLVWPAETPGILGIAKPLLSEAAVAEQLPAIRSGALTRISLFHLAGMVSLPSFHTIGALLVTWTFRHNRVLRWPLIVVNTLLIASTLGLGLHYACDVAAGAAVVLTTVLCCRYVAAAIPSRLATGTKELRTRTLSPAVETKFSLSPEQRWK